MARFHPRNWFDRVFELGIVLKGLDGAGELIAGTFLLLVRPATISHWVVILTRGELAEDPTDFIATHLVAAAHRLSADDLLFVSLYLLAHGLVKVVLVVAILRNQLWAFPWMIITLIAFICYQLYQIVVDPRISLVLLTIFDAVIVLLTWREYKIIRRRRAAETPVPSDDADHAHTR
ncbi:DUF2127 domain-containing protein [Microlunatus elymi]|uniref:DUF2127 domain-containing protein n=1 Tax=Microlunatus elymi TaxID=2596828 RepID=A0A516PYM4_9ACTN|nr:DUF2127 domain-containing protein [Microlunatus elymi]QDP96289.1 DUF2127 domain-containing protein [Microlunatus elymi]